MKLNVGNVHFICSRLIHRNDLIPFLHSPFIKDSRRPNTERINLRLIFKSQNLSSSQSSSWEQVLLISRRKFINEIIVTWFHLHNLNMLLVMFYIIVNIPFICTAVDMKFPDVGTVEYNSLCPLEYQEVVLDCLRSSSFIIIDISLVVSVPFKPLPLMFVTLIPSSIY